MSDHRIQLVSSNKEQVLEVYAQIDVFVASLVRAIPDATKLSPAHEAAIRALVEYGLLILRIRPTGTDRSRL